MKLGEAAADFKAIHDEHGDADFNIELAAHRETGAGEQRVTDDEVRHHGANVGVGVGVALVI